MSRDRLVAMKFQSLSELLKEFDHAKDAKRELDLLVELQELRSPFIMQLRGAFVTDRHLVLVMPLLLGGDLRYHLEEYGHFELERTRLLTAEICCGLEAIHSLGVVYRDLKPENIVLCEENHARITDFDRSRHMSEDATEDEIMEYTGTAGYMAPELINLEKYDQGIDVWSLGCLVFELLHAHHPFKAEVCFMSHVDPKNFPSPEFHKRLDKHSEVKNLICAMLQYNLRNRIGCKHKEELQGDGGKDQQHSRRVNWEEIKSHEFFDSLDWKKVLAEKTAPPTLITLEERVEKLQSISKCKSNWCRKNAKTLTEKERKLAKEIFSDYMYCETLSVHSPMKMKNGTPKSGDESSMNEGGKKTVKSDTS